MHKNIILRSKVISFIRSEMLKLGFLEYQTPILTSSSPEGARDFFGSKQIKSWEILCSSSSTSTI